MKLLIVKSFWLGLISTSLILTACSSGGGGGGGSSADLSPVGHLSYTGETNPAAIDIDSVDAVGGSVTESTSEAVGSDSTASTNPFGAVINLNNANSPLSKKVAEISLKALRDKLSSSLPAGVTYTSDQLNSEGGVSYFCGGSVSVTDTYANGSSENGTINFSNLCFDISVVDPMQSGQLVINGKITISVSGYIETVSYENLTITYNSETFTFSGTEICDYSTFECKTLYVGGDGKTYMAANVSVSGDNASGYNISATFYDPTYGEIVVTTDTAITFNCPGGIPDSGVITFTGATGTLGTSTATITFNDCSTYTIIWEDGNGNNGIVNGAW